MSTEIKKSESAYAVNMFDKICRINKNLVDIDKMMINIWWKV